MHKDIIIINVFFSVTVSVFLFGILFGIPYAIYHELQRHKIWHEQATQKWNHWVKFRDQHCHVTEKIYGLYMTSGKFHQNDNATVYECDDGIKYTVAQSVESAASQGTLQTEQVPEPFKP